jgi:putative glutamine amidotransferase
LCSFRPTSRRKATSSGIPRPETYQQALLRAGAIPVALPATVSRAVLAACVRRCDGVLLTGGEDLDPRHYARRLPRHLRGTVTVTPDGGARDRRELLLVRETLRQGKPLLAICRGQQVLNVALGGSLIVDIRAQRPDALEHCRRDRRYAVVHQARLTPDSLLRKIVGRPTLGVNSTHHQAVARVAAPLRVVATSPDGIIEALEWKPGRKRRCPFLLSVQFHPERLADRYPEHRAIFRAFARACRMSRKTAL